MRNEPKGRAPRRLVEERDGSETARLLASAARPVTVPPGARQRVITEALARRPATSNGWWLVALAGPALALFVWWAVGVGRGTAEPFARIAASEGEVRIEQPGRSVAAARAGGAVAEGARLATGTRGGAAVSFADLELRLGQATGATIQRRPSGGVEIGLERGEVSLVVGRRPPDRSVVVGAAGYSVVVVGTVFTVRASGQGAVHVTVAEGRVRVTGPGVDQLVPAGSSWSSRTPAAAVIPAPPPAPAMALATGTAPGEQRARPQAPRKRRARPLAPRVAAAPPGTKVPLAPAATPPQPAVAPPATSPAALPERTPPAASVRAAQPARKHDHEQAYDRAQELAARGDYAQAAAAFARLADGGPRAELALYERGLLLLKKLEEPERARRVFLEHRRRFPDSSLTPEVDLSLIEASLQARELPEAAREIEVFLARHPSSERRDELRLLRANLARDAGDCVRAERDYQSLAQGTGKLAEQALHSWAYCRRRLGDEAGARMHLREYLRRFPSGRHRGDVEQALEGER